MKELPKPISIVYCGVCDDVTRLDHDKHGWFCSSCFKPLAWLRGRYGDEDATTPISV